MFCVQEGDRGGEFGKGEGRTGTTDANGWLRAAPQPNAIDIIEAKPLLGAIGPAGGRRNLAVRNTIADEAELERKYKNEKGFFDHGVYPLECESIPRLYDRAKNGG